MLLSMKTRIRSSLSLERALLWTMALEKDFFTTSRFSSYKFNAGVRNGGQSCWRRWAVGWAWRYGFTTDLSARRLPPNKRLQAAPTSWLSLISSGSAATDMNVSSLLSSSLQAGGSSLRQSCSASRAVAHLAFAEEKRDTGGSYRLQPMGWKGQATFLGHQLITPRYLLSHNRCCKINNKYKSIYFKNNNNNNMDPIRGFVASDPGFVSYRVDNTPGLD